MGIEMAAKVGAKHPELRVKRQQAWKADTKASC
jgi:hypothetical protein